MANPAAILIPGAVLFVLLAAASWAATGLAARVLRRRGVLDRPNERSSHAAPTPRGGGVAVIGVLLAAWSAATVALPAVLPFEYAALAATVGLATVSWIDDLNGLPPLPRLAAQAAAVGLVMAFWPDGALVFQGLVPAWADRLMAALAWLWFVNLFNFMDGIDGLAGVEAATIGLGLAALAFVGLDGSTALVALMAAACALGFLRHNWPPARIFLGDVGSVPLGFVFGWLLLDAAAAGHWAPALILPLYFLADATLTLARRAARGERVWTPHREHFYQLAVRRGLSHAAVLAPVLVANLALVALALLAARAPWAALVGAAAVVGVLLAVLAGRRGA